MVGAHLFGLPNVFQAGLEPEVVAVTAVAVAAVVVVAAHLFSQCNMHGEAFHGLGVQGV
jgi:hypothetical protein